MNRPESDEVIITSRGFELTQPQYRFIRKALKVLQEKSPSHSTLTLTLDLRAVDYFGELVITSPTRVFQSFGEDNSLFVLVEDLKEQVDYMLAEWKSQRTFPIHADFVKGPGDFFPQGLALK